MSRKTLAKDIIMPMATASVGEAPATLAALQQFVATKRRCLANDAGAGAGASAVEPQNPQSSLNAALAAPKPSVLDKIGAGNEPFWRRFYQVECALNSKLQDLVVPAALTHIYNPIEYAAELHCAYLRKFLDGPKRLVFVGMNPGPNGMGQTGIPFGNILTVRDEMGIVGRVLQPPSVHPKRLITGLECGVEEPSGIRIWTLMKKLAAGSLSTFARNCFMHNFCPLIFLDKAGRNITPSELKGDYKTKIGQVCLEALDNEIDLLQPEIIVAIGSYIETILKHSRHVGAVRILKLHHPSPRALNNQNWPQKAEELLQQYDLVKYICDAV